MVDHGKGSGNGTRPHGFLGECRIKYRHNRPVWVDPKLFFFYPYLIFL
jgi:hypothetical protein